MASRTRRGTAFTLPMKRSAAATSPGPRTEVATTKGVDGNDVFTIELNGITQRLQRLRLSANRSIRSLTGQLKEDFQALAYYVQLLYDSPEYDVLYDRIRSIFGDLTDLQPGTVGAYFGGCLNRNPTMGSCALTCVDAVPPPDANFRFCDTLVVWAIWDGREYQITPINASSIPNNRRNQAYVFVEVTNYDQFPGFNEAERAKLQRLGVREVQFIYYAADGRRYERLTNTFIPLAQVRERGVNDPVNQWPGSNDIVIVPTDGLIGETVVGTSTGGGTVLIVVLVVIFLILLLFFGWRSWAGSTDEAAVVTAVNVSAEPVSSSVIVGPAFPVASTVTVGPAVGGPIVQGRTNFVPLL